MRLVTCGCVILALAAPGPFSHEVASCECGPKLAPTPEYIASAAVVFAGTAVAEVLEREPFDGRLFAKGTRTLFAVSEVWKGDVPSSGFVWIMSPAGCGYSFEIGESYVVFAFSSTRGLTTSMCDFTSPSRDASSTMAILGPPKTLVHQDQWLRPPLCE